MLDLFLNKILFICLVHSRVDAHNALTIWSNQFRSFVDNGKKATNYFHLEETQIGLALARYCI